MSYLRRGSATLKEVNREILLAFWKVHILHHAGEEPVHGKWILTELRTHGYEISPGTLYPLLQRLEKLGWLKCEVAPGGGRRARRNYRLTALGREVLVMLREQVTELYQEVVADRRKGAKGR